MSTNSKLNSQNDFCKKHADLLIYSYHSSTGKNLLKDKLVGEEPSAMLYEAPYGIVSHNTDPDPVFNYGNKIAQQLFQMSWSVFTSTPSRKSAEIENREKRNTLLSQVSEKGFIEGYRGIRISSTGKRFIIENTTIWNVVNRNNEYCGQAAVFYNWTEL